MVQKTAERRPSVQEEAGELLRYRNALKEGDRRVLDRLIGLAKNHVSACASADRLDMLESMLLAIVIEQQKTIERLAESAHNRPAPCAGHSPSIYALSAPTLNERIRVGAV